MFYEYAIVHLEGMKRKKRWRNEQVLTWQQGCGGCEGGSTAWHPERKMKQLNHKAYTPSTNKYKHGFRESVLCVCVCGVVKRGAPGRIVPIVPDKQVLRNSKHPG